MGTLTYSHTLVAGTNENVNDVQDMFNDARTVINGNIDGANAPALVSNVRTHHVSTLQITQSLAAGTYFVNQLGTLKATAVDSGGAAVMFSIIAADLTMTGLTPKMRLRTTMATNATAPGINFTMGLYPVSSVAGASGNQLVTLGTVVAGSTIARNAPTASTLFADVTSDFSLPSDGPYIFGVVTSGANALNSTTGITFQLQVHWV